MPEVLFYGLDRDERRTYAPPENKSSDERTVLSPVVVRSQARCVRFRFGNLMPLILFPLSVAGKRIQRIQSSGEKSEYLLKLHPVNIR